MTQHSPTESYETDLAAEFQVAVETFRDGRDYQAAESFATWLGDTIDDRVALALDEQLAERLEEPGPIRRAVLRGKRTGAAVVCASAAIGGTVTIFSSAGAATLLIAWGAIAMINLAYFFHRG
jgi:hypothetical protein